MDEQSLHSTGSETGKGQLPANCASVKSMSESADNRPTKDAASTKSKAELRAERRALQVSM